MGSSPTVSTFCFWRGKKRTEFCANARASTPKKNSIKIHTLCRRTGRCRPPAQPAPSPWGPPACGPASSAPGSPSLPRARRASFYVPSLARSLLTSAFQTPLAVPVSSPTLPPGASIRPALLFLPSALPPRIAASAPSARAHRSAHSLLPAAAGTSLYRLPLLSVLRYVPGFLLAAFRGP